MTPATLVGSKTDPLLSRVRVPIAYTRKKPRPTATMLPPAVVGVVLLVIWQIIATLADSDLVPTPAAVVVQTVENFQDPDFLANLLSTIKLVTIAYVVTVVLGTVVGFAVGTVPFLNHVVALSLFVLYAIPNVVLFPIFLLFLGITETTQIAFGFAHGFIPMTLVVLAAMNTIPQTRLMLAASLRVPTRTLFWRITVPSILSSITTGMRISFGLVFIGVVLGEMLFGQAGLGVELVLDISLGRMGDIISLVFVIAVIAMVPTGLLRALEVRTTGRYRL